MIAPRPIYALLMAGAAGIASTSNVSAAPDDIACANFETVTFPTVGPGVTTWDICYQAENKHGLTLQSVSFKKSSSFPSIQILSDARLAEMFVPYHSGHPRVFDIRDSSVALLSLSSTDCPPPHSLIGGGLVCKELRDRGVAWKNNGLVRRGEELVLWSVLGGATYNYIIEWRFHDEGTIVGRVGLTGPKNEGPNDNRGHMHNATWRLDIDLNGAQGDSVFKTKHIESEGSLVATDSEVLIATERGIVWNPTQFTTLKIGDSALVNPRGRPTTYELIPLRRGIYLKRSQFKILKKPRVS